MLDQDSPAIGIIWPEAVSYKFIAGKKQTWFKNTLKVALLYDTHNPKIGNPLTSIPSSLPVENYVPGYTDAKNLKANAYIFYLDKNKQNVCSYCNATGEVKILFNIVKETDTHQNRYSKFEVFPNNGGGLYDTYRFLIRSEIDRQYNMCFIFAYNMQKKRFSDHVKQFSGIDCIFIGDQKNDSPALVILQEDMQTILIAELKAKEELGLPRGDLKLSAMVKGLYPSPLRKGLALLYVLQNKVKFSRNRDEANGLDDFKILDGTRDYFRLSYDEVVFNITWQAASTEDVESVHGALVTNKRISIVDSHLKALRNINIHTDFSYNFVYSSYWFGQTLLYSTQNQVHYCDLDGESQIIFTFNDSRSVICDALADRISIATYDSQDNIVITTRKVYMLEPLIMGKLSYTKSDSEIDQKFLKCVLKNLDTSQISKKLIQKMLSRQLYNSAWFLLQNAQSPQFSLIEKFECLSHLHSTKTLFEWVFGPNKDIMESRTDLAEAITRMAKSGEKLEKVVLEFLHKEFNSLLQFNYAMK